MKEAAAIEIVAVRAVETADGEGSSWSDVDRAWASRAAAEIVGEGAAPATFIARRARLVLERLSERASKIPRAVHSWRWRSWVGTAIVLVAFLVGLAANYLGNSQSINILAPPALALLAWNLVMYIALIAGLVSRIGKEAGMGLARRLVAWLGARLHAPRSRSSGNAESSPGALARFARDWPVMAAPLYTARAARILHCAAAAVAAGVIAGLYFSGLVFEYRATWESTFLDPAAVRAIVATAYLPGALLTGLPVPDVAEITALRAPGSENAALWLHLVAATLAAVVIGPRLLLATVTGMQEWYRARHLPVPLDEPYFQRLLRGFLGGKARVDVLPFSFSLPAESRTALEAILARTFGGTAALTFAASVPFGGDGAPAIASGTTDPLIAVFNMTATPESESQGVFLTALAKAAPSRPLLVIIDESAFRARLGAVARLDERRSLWREFCLEQRLTPVFVDLAKPDIAAADAALDAALAKSGQRS